MPKARRPRRRPGWEAWLLAAAVLGWGATLGHLALASGAPRHSPPRDALAPGSVPPGGPGALTPSPPGTPWELGTVDGLLDLLASLPGRVSEDDAAQLLVPIPGRLVDAAVPALPGLEDASGDLRCYPWQGRFYPYFAFQGHAYPYYHYRHPQFRSFYLEAAGPRFRPHYYQVDAPDYVPGYYYYFDYADQDDLAHDPGRPNG